MLKNQRQNLVMENEFHIKEERVKAQQSSAKTTHDKDSSHTDSAAGKDDKAAPASTPTPSKLKAIKTEPSDSKPMSITAKVSAGAGAGAAKSKLSATHEVVVKKEGSSSTSEPATKKNGEKAKEKNPGKDIMVRKATVKEELNTPCWDIAPTDPASTSTSQPVSGTTTPSSTASGEKAAVGRHGSPSVHNGPAAGIGAGASPRSGQRRQIKADSPDTATEKGEVVVVSSCHSC